MGSVSECFRIGWRWDLGYDTLRGSRPDEDNVEAYKEVIELARKYKLSPISAHYPEA